jgi:hypothetical protein
VVAEIAALLRRAGCRYATRLRGGVAVGTGFLAVAVVAGLAGLGAGPAFDPAGDHRPSGATRAAPAEPGTRPAARPTPGAVGAYGAGGDSDALTYLRQRGSRAARHAENVRWSGEFLRVYTDLSEYDDNSRAAVELCHAASAYLADRLGKARPVVFVHAAESGNGHVVLANKLSAGDSCSVGSSD